MTTGSGGPVAPPGWYPDGEGWERRWDGSAWTEERRPVAAAPAARDERPAEASPMEEAEATVVRRGPVAGDDATVVGATPPLPPTPAPEEAIWAEHPHQADAPPGPDQAVWPADQVTPEEEPSGTPKPGYPPAGPPAQPPVAATQVGPPGGQPAPAPHAPPDAAAPPAAQPWSPAPPPPPAQAWSPPPTGPVGGTGGGTGAPAYPYPQPGGYGTPPPAKKKSLLWLWVVLGVVLVVLAGTAVTLVVTKPWDEDSGSSAAGNEGGEEGGDGGEEQAPEPVAGDVTGDGKGDAIADLTNDAKTFRITLTSTGTSFDVDEKVIPAHEQLVWGDFDGDGALEVLSWTADGEFVITSEDGSFPEASASLGLWDRAPEVEAHVGDYDGDGLDDVAVHGQTDKDSVAVWVLRSNGEGFDAATQWLTLDNTSWGSTSLFEGDWDGDGVDDLLALLPTGTLKKSDYDSGYFDREMGVALMKSDGSAFQPGSISPLGGETQIHQGDLVLGDFTGEGTPMIAVEDEFAEAVKVFEYDGTDLVEVSGFELGFTEGGVKGGIEAIGVSDLDGDRKDDLVFVTYDFDTEQYEGFLVARSSGTGFSPVETWAETPECKDFCYMEFEQGN